MATSYFHRRSAVKPAIRRHRVSLRHTKGRSGQRFRRSGIKRCPTSQETRVKGTKKTMVRRQLPAPTTKGKAREQFTNAQAGRVEERRIEPQGNRSSILCCCRESSSSNAWLQQAAHKKPRSDGPLWATVHSFFGQVGATSFPTSANETPSIVG